MATARSLFKLWLGFSPHRSGVFSAGNGPAMRAALVGSYFSECAEKRKRFNRLQTRLTHTDPKAEIASLAIVEIAALHTCRGNASSATEIILTLRKITDEKPWQDILTSLENHLTEDKTLTEFLTDIGGNPKRGISGYCYQTVPSVIFVGIKNDWKPTPTLSEIWQAGGDTDTTGAIAGALCGLAHGPESFPHDWRTNFAEWPVKSSNLEKCAALLANEKVVMNRNLLNPALLLRNLLFLITVLSHGFLRLKILLLKSN